MPNPGKTSKQMKADAQRRHVEANHGSKNFWRCRDRTCINATARVKKRQAAERGRY